MLYTSEFISSYGLIKHRCIYSHFFKTLQHVNKKLKYLVGLSFSCHRIIVTFPLSTQGALIARAARPAAGGPATRRRRAAPRPTRRCWRTRATACPRRAPGPALQHTRALTSPHRARQRNDAHLVQIT